MILQYQGFKNNLCYEEADIITETTVPIPKIAEGFDRSDLSMRKEISEKIEQTIRNETNCANITYITNKDVCTLGVVKVVILSLAGKETTYVFDVERQIYLLNNYGKTIRKI